MRLVGNSSNVCSGMLQIEGNKAGIWSPVMSEETISPDVACKHMYCGTSASYSLESGGMQLNCTGKSTEPVITQWQLSNSSLRVVFLCLVALLPSSS